MTMCSYNFSSPIHFIGIGGNGMSGIAAVLNGLGFEVRGSDVVNNYNAQRLRNLGISVNVGHDPANIDDAKLVVFSSAIKQDNPELAFAKLQDIPVIHRADMLAKLMRSKRGIAVGGTHGKTTTTAIVASLLDAAGMSPTTITGGVINSYGSNVNLGTGKWIVVESDESDASFVRLPAEVVVVTNISREHLNYYGTFERLQGAFKQFIENIPRHGFAVLCSDDPVVNRLISKIDVDHRIVKYGFAKDADIRCISVRSENGVSRFSVSLPANGRANSVMDLTIKMLGKHNVSNACAAVAVATQLGLTSEDISRGLFRFSGVQRRFTHTGTHNGIHVFDDYGHHPFEIDTVLKMAAEVVEAKFKKGCVIAVVQPNRYTRLAALFSEFCRAFTAADYVLVTDVYSGMEDPIPGINKKTFVDGLRATGHLGALSVDHMSSIPAIINDIAKPGSYVITFGPGDDIARCAQELPQKLAALSG